MGGRKVVEAGEVGALSRTLASVLLKKLNVHRVLEGRKECMVV